MKSLVLVIVLIQSCLQVDDAFKHSENIDIPGPDDFCITSAMRVVYKENPVDLNIRISQSRWKKHELEISYLPTHIDINQLLYKVYEAQEVNNFKYYDFFQAARTAHLFSLMAIIKYFGLIEPGFMNRGYILKGIYNYADFTGKDDKEFELKVKFKDEIAMMIHMVIDKERVRKFIEDSKLVIDEEDSENIFNKDLKTPQFKDAITEPGVLDYRQMVKSIPKFDSQVDLKNFIKHTKMFFGILTDKFYVNQGGMAQYLGNDIFTGFMKTTEDSIIDTVNTDPKEFTVNATFTKFDTIQDITLNKNADDYDKLKVMS